MLNIGDLSKNLTFDILEKLKNIKQFIRPGAGGSLSTTYGYDATLLIVLDVRIVRCNVANNPNTSSISF